MGKKVLIVDDAAFMRMMLKDILQKNNFEVITKLNTIFGEIAGKISAAMQNAHVSDPMGTGFQIPVGEVSNIQATPSTPAPSYNASTHTLIWNPGTINTPIAPNSDIKYAELKYRVDISDLILSIQPPPTNGEYNTNGNAHIEDRKSVV